MAKTVGQKLLKFSTNYSFSLKLALVRRDNRLVAPIDQDPSV